MTKKQSERAHAQQRLAERYGLVVSGKEYKGIVRLIAESSKTNPTARLIEYQSQRVSVWEVPWNDIMLKAVFDKFRQEIVTFLPLQSNYVEQMAA
jgi:hypothetical protein